MGCSNDLFIVHVPKRVVNEGGYIESAYDMKEMMSDDTDTKVEGIDFMAMFDEILTNDLDVRLTYWTKLADHKHAEVKFGVEGDRTEAVMNHLLSLGVGDRFGSIWIHPLDVSRPRVECPVSPTYEQKFAESIKSRMIVEKVVESARASAMFSFDYVMLVVVASILALLGLANNNVVVIVASMLVSPIMGPVVAATFGTIIKDWSLVKLGLWSEMLSLAICVATGFLFGLPLVPFSDILKWPTDEMNSRGDLLGLTSGILVAIPSGVGVALSILGNNTSSLVGVAISASLLPPAVNTGVLFAIAAMAKYYHPRTPTAQELVDSSLEKAMFSILITLANIIVIFGMALVMFKVKEVAPIPGKTRFWKEDVKMSRQYKSVLRGEEAATYAEQIRKMIPKVRQDPEIQSLETITPCDGNSINHYFAASTVTRDTFGSFGLPRVSEESSTKAKTPDLMSLFDDPDEAIEIKSETLREPARPPLKTGSSSPCLSKAYVNRANNM